MIQFQIRDMTSSRCVRSLAGALASVAPAARIFIDMQAKRVSVEAAAGAELLEEAIRKAGYSAVRLAL
jgi:copper chaperone CopZ